jgi:hypothetical protein
VLTFLIVASVFGGLLAFWAITELYSALTAPSAQKRKKEKIAANYKKRLRELARKRKPWQRRGMCDPHTDIPYRA